MTNVVSLTKTCEYLIGRATKHRLAGRYDEAMALLSRAKDQFGLREDVELEMARVYDQIGREDEAARSYLRVVRMGGKHKALALFHLALSGVQQADMPRALSYFEQFAALGCDEVSPEMALTLFEQLDRELDRSAPVSKKGRARVLESRAAERLQEGKTSAARRTLMHAARLRPTAQGYTLLACCHLLRGEAEDAVSCAQMAHRLAPSHVHTLCMLADSLAAADEEREARRVVYLAALRAVTQDELGAVAMVSAKRGEDRLTLLLTRSLLRREPFHTRGMMLRACALTNLGRLREASRLFGRLCGLLPEDTVCEAFYRQTRDGEKPQERLALGIDVTRQEGVSRAMELISALYMDPAEMSGDAASQRSLCRLCAWAFRSPMAGAHTKTVALIVMNAMDTDASRGVLLDALTDPQIDDGLKSAVLQVLTAKEGFLPYDVDFGGRLVRLAAGGVIDRPVRTREIYQEVVQRASDALSQDFPDAPQVILPVFIAYLNRYGTPRGRMADACVAALEYAYHSQSGHRVKLDTIARRTGVSPRLCRVCLRRFERAQQGEAQQTQGGQKA